MCFECIFNYFLLPLFGAYSIYYFGWSMLAKPLKELNERMLKNNEENRIERDQLKLFRQTLCDEVEAERNQLRADLELHKKISLEQLNVSINDMRSGISEYQKATDDLIVEWKDPGQKLKNEIDRLRIDTRSILDDHMKKVVGRVDTMSSEVNYMKLHKQDKV